MSFITMIPINFTLYSSGYSDGRKKSLEENLEKLDTKLKNLKLKIKK